MDYIDFHTHQDPQCNRIFNLVGKNAPKSPYSYGIHPWSLNEDWKSLLSEIENNIHDPNLWAIGECGFDLARGPEGKTQLAAFTAQAQLAHKHSLPLILHCVKGVHLLQQFLKTEKNPPAIIWHGFNQKESIAQSLLQYPIYFSFGEAIFKEDSNAQNWLKNCPIDRIFLETDTSEKNISSIYEQASLILRLPVQTLDRQLKENWKKISKRGIDE
ncbi:TatD family hydrolase [Cecembia rubra]|uniref:TatD family hydrolase n=1 Tax=Cecembia rubra TaxID=1485585 RepID=UPI002F410DBD